RLEARLTEGADPFLMSAGAEDDALPFVLTGPASGALLAEYYADQLRAAADGARLAGSAADPGEVARSLVPGLPFKAQTMEGEAVFDGETVRLSWPRLMYSAEKWRQKGRILAAERILRAEWQEPGISGYGGVRFLLREDPDVSAALPVYRDTAALTSMTTRSTCGSGCWPRWPTPTWPPVPPPGPRSRRGRAGSRRPWSPRRRTAGPRPPERRRPAGTPKRSSGA